MKKNVKVIAVALLVSASTFGIVGCTQSASANEIVATETTTTETTTDATTEVSLDPMARVYTEEELSDSYEDYSTITLKDGGSTSDNSSVTIEDDVITITEAGTYEISGTLTDGQIVVDTKDEEKVQLVLNGVDISNSTNSPIYIEKAKDYAMITLKEGSVNTLTDAETYVLPESTDGTTVEDLDSTIYSKADLVINGTGSLTVNANYNDGIKSKDSLLIANGDITVNAVHDAIYGKDALTVLDGDITITTNGGSALAEMPEEEFGGMGQMPNGDFTGTPPEMPEGGFPEMPQDMTGTTETTDTGFVPIPEEMVDSTNSATVNTPPEMPTTETATTEEVVVENTESNKGLKSGGEIVIDGGIFTLDTYDDAINANTFVEINDGVFNIKSGNDAIKSEYLLTINGGEINISYCYEGLEAMDLYLNGGDINIVSEDDGINASDPNSTETMGMPQGSDQELTEDDPVIYIDGANVIVNASGDAIDSNGGFVMNSGNVVIHGVNNGGELALDFDKRSTVNGGSLLVLGGSANISDSSTQNVVIAPLTTTFAKGSTLQVLDEKNNVIFETVLERDTNSVTFSSSDIKQGKTYTITDGTNETTVTTSTDSTITGSAQNTMGGGGRGQKPEMPTDATTSATTSSTETN